MVRRFSPLPALLSGIGILSSPAWSQSTPPTKIQENAAATPPMGWNPFNAFRLDYDEATILSAADALIQQGLADAGYQYVVIDDGWWLKRKKDGIEIRTRLFPSAKFITNKTSFRLFTDKIHNMGLKAGIYTDIGRNTCSQHWDKNSPNLPTGTLEEREVGAMDHHSEDAHLFFVDWNFDFVKVDACGVADYAADTDDVRAGKFRAYDPLIVRGTPGRSAPDAVASLYASFTSAIKAAKPLNTPIIAICAWGEADVNNWAGRYGQMWRTSPDIRQTWASMLGNFDSAAPRSLFAGPGRWNDPDLLEVGNGDFDGAHLTEARAHMAMWAIIAAPLMLSYDLKNSPTSISEIAGNREVIAINQDSAGNQGVILSATDQTEVIVKQMAQLGDKAVALINRSDRPVTLSVGLDELNLGSNTQTLLRDVWKHSSRPFNSDKIEVALAPRETALFRIQGTPADPRFLRPSEMPARITVIEDGYKPADRSATRPWVPARIGYTPAGVPIEAGGKRDYNALGVAAGSRLRIASNGNFRKLHIQPGGDSADKQEYAIYGDGKVLHKGLTNGAGIVLPIDQIKNIDLVAPSAVGKSIDFVWGLFSLQR